MVTIKATTNHQTANKNWGLIKYKTMVMKNNTNKKSPSNFSIPVNIVTPCIGRIVCFSQTFGYFSCLVGNSGSPLFAGFWRLENQTRQPPLTRQPPQVDNPKPRWDQISHSFLFSLQRLDITHQCPHLNIIKMPISKARHLPNMPLFALF